MSNTNKERTTDSGLKYVLTEKGKGKKPLAGDKIRVHYTGRLPEGTKFDSSFDRNMPLTFTVGVGQVIKGWDEAFLMFEEGTKATLVIPPELAYGERGAPPHIPPSSTLTFEVEFLDIVEPPKPFETKGLDTIKLESGLSYIKVKTVDGLKAEAFKQVSVHYTGYLENGSIFDSSVQRGQPFAFQLGVGRVIKGWDEGIAQLRVGEKARFIIPPDMAYGTRGYPPQIPENATLIFDVELLDVQ